MRWTPTASVASMQAWMITYRSRSALSCSKRNWNCGWARTSKRRATLGLDAAEHLALSRKAAAAFHGEARRYKVAPDETGGGISCKGSVGLCLFIDEAHQFRRPHVGIARWGEAVKIPRIESCLGNSDPF